MNRKLAVLTVFAVMCAALCMLVSGCGQTAAPFEENPDGIQPPAQPTPTIARIPVQYELVNSPVTNIYINGEKTAQPAQKHLPEGEGGTMPSLGMVRPLFILVDFPDHSYKEYEADYSLDKVSRLLFGKDESNIWGYDSSDLYPYESLRNYYARASYGRLQLDGKTLGWFTAGHEQAYYEEHDGPVDILKEALAYYDAQEDFGAYDSDNDGAIDCVVLLYASDMPVNSQGMWYSFVYSRDAMAEADGVRVDQLGFMGLDDNHITMMQTIIHELGHFFRLPDYYDSKGGMFLSEGGMWASDIMMDKNGDMNAFSKFMLGWMENVYIVTDSRREISLRPISEAGDMAIVAPEYDSPLSEYFAVEYITHSGNNTLLGWYPTSNSGSAISAEKRPSGLRILRVNAEAGEYGFKQSNAGTGNKLIESVKKGVWEMFGDGKDQYRLLLYRDGESFTPNTYPSSYSSSGQFTGACVQDIRISPDDTKASFTAGIAPELDSEPVSFSPVTEVRGAVPLIANTEITYTGKASPYLMVGGKKVSMDVMDIRANSQENRAMLLCRNKAGLTAGSDTPCQLVIPKGAFINKLGTVNEQVIFDVSARFRDMVIENNDILDTAGRINHYFRVNDTTAGLLNTQGNDLYYRTISSKGEVSDPSKVFSIPEGEYVAKFIRLGDGSIALATAGPGDQQGTDIHFLSSGLELIQSVRVPLPNCEIAPFRNGVVAAGCDETDSPAAYYAEAGMSETESLPGDFAKLLTIPGYSSGSDEVTTYDIGNGEWLYLERGTLIQLAIVSQDCSVKAFRGWNEGDTDDFLSAEPILPGVPFGAVRTGDSEITLIMLEGVPQSRPVTPYVGSVYAVTLDNELNVLGKKFIRSYSGLRAANSDYFGQIVKLSGGYALPLTIDFTPEKTSSSPAGVVCFLDKDMNYAEEYWVQAPGIGSEATLVEFTPGEYLIGTWYSIKILSK